MGNTEQSLQKRIVYPALLVHLRCVDVAHAEQKTRSHRLVRVPGFNEGNG